MKKQTYLTSIAVALALVLNICFTYAQDAKPRKSPKATVSQRIGVDTDIVIDYSRPAVRGRTIWGELVPYGMYEGNKYSDEKPFPWRAGANENTTISFSKDVKVEGKMVPAGKYGLHMLAGKDEFKVMLNKVNNEWGSYKYDSSQDVLSITVKPEQNQHTEWLEYEFDDISDTGTKVYLKWAKLKIPIKIQL